MTTADIAWAAGFFEGEGSVGRITHKRPYGRHLYHYIYATAAQVNAEPLERLQALFGGHIVHRVDRRNGKPISNWSTQGAHAERFFKAVWPWLSTRRQEQIERIRARVLERATT